MNVLTCEVPEYVEIQLDEMARTRGVHRSVLIREAIEAKISHEPAPARKQPANLIEALGDGVGCIDTGSRDLARNKKHLAAYGR